jgi:uncharacterized protein (DUF1800 family)
MKMLRTLVAALAFASGGAMAAPNAALGYDDARHLLARTGFGPSEAEVRAFAPLTREQAVAKLLRESRTTAVTPAPASALDTSPLRPPRGPEATESERKAFREQQVRQGLELRGWWVREMLVTPSPMTERMTLFWHNHFVSAQPKVRIARLMYRQNVTLREYALGNFGALLHAMARDPAMVVYLDSVQNRKGAPNENFAREVMELFTLGEGHYGEQDVKEAARAFTGWSLDRETGAFMFRRFLHDDGSKTVLGKSGRLDGDAVLDILLARPETAEFIVTKLWREFVSPDPDSAAIARIARRFRESNYDIRTALRELLASDAFYAPENRGVLVKSPVELVVGTLRALEIAPEQALPFAVAAAGMGQNLMSPPNVKGWPGGETWINTTTLLARKQFLDRVVRADDGLLPAAMTSEGGAMDMERAAPKPALAPQGVTDDAARRQRFLRQMERGLARLDFDSARWMAQFPGDSTTDREQAAQRLLLATTPQVSPDLHADSLTFVRGIVLDAAYQLK